MTTKSVFFRFNHNLFLYDFIDVEIRARQAAADWFGYDGDNLIAIKHNTSHKCFKPLPILPFMPTLIALLSAGKGTWTEVSRLISLQNWDKVFLITNRFGEENFNKKENTELVLVDAFKETADLAEQIKTQLKDKIKDFDVALT